MDLYGKAVLHDETFDQQREIEVIPFENFVADQVAHIGFQDIGKVVVSQETFGDDRCVVFEAAHVRRPRP